MPDCWRHRSLVYGDAAERDQHDLDSSNDGVMRIFPSLTGCIEVRTGDLGALFFGIEFSGLDYGTARREIYNGVSQLLQH